MALQSSFYPVDGRSRTYPQTKHIPTKQHAAVYSRLKGTNTWELLDTNLWNLINNSIVLREAFSQTTYDQIEVRIADKPSELTDSISDIATVAGLATEIVSLYNDKATLDSLYADKATLDSLYADKVTLDSLYADKATLDSLYADKATLDSLYADKATLDSLYADKVTLDSLYADKVALDAIYANLAEILLADDNAASASNSASAAATSATSAATSATSASNSATSASNSATSASNSATSASNSAADADTNAAATAADRAAVETTAGYVADNIDTLNTVSANIDNVNTTATNILDINTVSSNIDNVNTTATNILDINTVALATPSLLAVYEVGYDEPTVKSIGKQWFNTGNNTLYINNGTEWEKVHITKFAPAINYTLGRNFRYADDVNDNKVITNQGATDTTNDLLMYTGNPYAHEATNAPLTFGSASEYVSFYTIEDGWTFNQAAPYSIATAKTYSQIFVTTTSIGVADQTILASNIDELAREALDGDSTLSIPQTNITWFSHADVRQGKELYNNVFAPTNGTMFFDTIDTSTTYTFRSPVGTSLTYNGVQYNGNGNLSVSITGTEAGKQTFVESIDGALTLFYCHNNQLTGSIPSLSENISLIYFSCNNNQLTGSIPSLSANTALVNFYCQDNQLTGSIPSLSANTALIHFYCNSNQLTGSIPSLSANTVLVHFHCAINQLTGSIPSLSSNTALVNFYCYNNQLTGSIPSLSSNTALEYFHCHSNQLTGSIPSLTSNTALTDFQCQGNQLTGSIPSLSSNTALTYFSCHTNQLTGSIPSLTSNNALTRFYCYNNQLTGSIPSLTSNTALTHFYCYSNQLTGNIPSLSANTALTDFYCYSNQLTGFDGGNIKVTNNFNALSNALTQSAIDSILAGLVGGGTINATIRLDGGTNAAPSAVGQGHIDTLRANGCTVIVTGGY